jgi:hypothetical protein
LYEGEYGIQLKGSDSNHILPLIDSILINSNSVQNYELEWAKLLYDGINFNDWIIDSGDWFFAQNMYSQYSSFYDNNTFSSITLDSLFYNSKLVTSIDLKYEFEWDKDYLSFSYLNENNSIVLDCNLSGHQFVDFKNIIFSINQFDEIESLKLNISTDTDESLYYRGLVIDNIQVLSDSGLDLCFYGDINFDGLLNINDIMKILTYILENDQALGYYMCVSDINQDSGINILDIAILINMILGD